VSGWNNSSGAGASSPTTRAQGKTLEKVPSFVLRSSDRPGDARMEVFVLRACAVGAYVPTLLLTAQGTVATAVEAMREGPPLPHHAR